LLSYWQLKTSEKYKTKGGLIQDCFKQTFQSGLSKLFKRVGVIFPLISSRGKLSSPPATADEDESDALTVFLGTADAP